MIYEFRTRANRSIEFIVSIEPEPDEWTSLKYFPGSRDRGFLNRQRDKRRSPALLGVVSILTDQKYSPVLIASLKMRAKGLEVGSKGKEQTTVQHEAQYEVQHEVQHVQHPILKGQIEVVGPPKILPVTELYVDPSDQLRPLEWLLDVIICTGLEALGHIFSCRLG